MRSTFHSTFAFRRLHGILFATMARLSTAQSMHSCVQGMLCAVLLASVSWRANAAMPARGLSKIPARNVSAGYLNAIRMGTGSTSNKIASLNYEAVDIILLAFTGLNADGSLNHAYGNADLYRPFLIPQAHARSCSVLMSMVGEFETVTASASLRATAATNIANA